MVITFVNMVDPYKITCTQTPLGIISLYYILENNFETEICDLNYKYYKGEIKHHNKFRDNLIEIVKEIMKNQPQIVSIYSMCNTYHMSIIVGKLLKEMFPATKLILSGPHATLVAEDTLKDFQFVDYIGMGEGEKTILGNIKGILDNNFELFNGIAYRNYKSEIVTKWDRGNRINVNELKINDVCKINNPKDFNNILSIEGGRGCPFHCSFCSTQQFWGNIFQIKSIEKMLEEIEYYYNNYNITEFNIQHDLFTFDKNYILNFCDKLTKKVIPNINWGCSSRIDVITDVLLERMSNAGCSNIFYGIESGSDKIQKKINKNLKIDKVFDVVEKMMHLRMGATFSFIYGFPDETVEDKNATIKLIHEIKKKNYFDKSVNMDINLTCLNFLPGTQIGEQYYHQLEYNRLDGMTYYRNVKLDPIIDKLIRNHKRIFLHCYNLHKNTYIEQKYLGYFFMILFNELYFTFYNEIEELVQTYKYNYVKLYEQLFKKAKSDIIALCDYVYNTYGIIEEKVISKIFKKILKKNIMRYQSLEIISILYCTPKVDILLCGCMHITTQKNIHF